MVEHDSRLVIIRHAPYSSDGLREGLDVALVAAAFGQKVGLLFIGQGVFALLKEQVAGAPGQKATLPIIDMLPMYDIEQLLTPMGTLKALGIRADQLVEGVTRVPDETLPNIIKSYSHIFTF